AREVLDMADELGLVVWEEIPLVNEVTRNETYSEIAHQMLREMIKQHYNHPSIMIWAYMNEIYWAHRFKPEEELPSRNKYTIELARSLEKVCREMDPQRYTAMAMHNYPAYEETGIGDIPMIAGWNLYHGWYYDEFEDFGTFMDDEKRKHPNRVHIISEFGAGAHTGIHSDRPERFDFSIEGQVDFTQAIIKQIQERDYISGGALWNLVDFSSESRVDATPHINNKGLVTQDRKPKDAYLLAKALFSTGDVAELGYPFRTEWVYAAKNDQDTIAKVPMYVYSNLQDIELYVNGKNMGTRQPEYGKATWTLDLPEGDYVLSLHDSLAVPPKNISVKVIPYVLRQKNLDLAVSLGSNYTFTDERTDLQWIEEKEYTPGSWGYVGGERLYVARKIGTKEDILSIDFEDGLYQTMRTDIEAFRADVPDGVYEIQLLMVDYVPKSRRFVDDKEVNFRPGERIFDILINDDMVSEHLDLGGEYGQNVPVRLAFRYTISGGKGLHIKFNKHKGKPISSGIRIRHVGY
ncbi:MAG TPA: glycoside hydrolase family 2 TIM barrel-domain containing protein, partial [Sphingobacterium sp.]|nr:glycoside hydrolase family 2 TIM barrel-domain containing protein [Sphingobacterium sp.]